MVGGVERYFQIAPCFRDEASRADRSPGEFYQIDLEMAFATQEDVFARGRAADGAHRGGVLDQGGAGRRSPGCGFAEAIDRFGTDKPDLRFELEIARRHRGGWGAAPSCRCSPRPRRGGT